MKDVERMNPYLISLVALVTFMINDVNANETKAMMHLERHFIRHP